MDCVNMSQDVRLVDCCCLGKEHVVLIQDGKILGHPGECQLLSEESPY